MATTNAGKAREFVEILGPTVKVTVPDSLPLVVEDGKTLAENAFKKARSAADHLGRSAVADDSGLFVDALKGQPGVHSARFAGPDSDDAANRAKLISLLAGVVDRSAYFATTLCLCTPLGSESSAFYFEGICRGQISLFEKGDQGFGYDSIFVPSEGDGRTFGEMAPFEKAMISHRARAISKLKEWLPGVVL